MARFHWFCVAGSLAALAAPFGCGDAAAPADSGGPAVDPGDLAVACPEGFADCDGDASNGCEAALETSARNCGACGVACASANADPLCSAGKCIGVCKAGFADCDGDASNGCEVDTVTDPAHCGSCSRSCGASCAYAACDTAVLASAQERATLLAVDDEAVYWSNQGSPERATGAVMRVPKGGGAPVVLASNQAIPLGIAVSETSLYWANLGLTPGSGAVMTAPKQGGPATVLAHGQSVPFPIALDGDWLYWTNQGSSPGSPDAGVMRISLVDPGAAPETRLAVPERPNSLCIGETTIYFTVPGSGGAPDGSLRALAKAGAPGDPATVVADGLVLPGALLCAQASVYVRTATSILAFPVAGGAPATIAGDLVSPALLLASDGASLYWTAASPAGQTVEAAALDGSSRRTIASAQTGVVDVAVDAASVYWTRFATTSDPGTGVVLAAPK